MSKTVSVDENFSFYNDEVEAMLSRFNRDQTFCDDSEKTLEGILNSAPTQALFKTFSRETLRGSGIFFTSNRIAEKVALMVKGDLESGSAVLDPTCGGGDLLLAASDFFEYEKTVEKTIRNWGQRVIGGDIFKTFVDLCIQRLTLKASIQHGELFDFSVERLRQYFPNIIQNDFLLNGERQIARANNILMNPPYCKMSAPKNLNWCTGSISSAALFVSHVLQKANIGTRITAILPDVLRSGTRYRKWRESISKDAQIKEIKLLGQFSDNADIHVFILDIRKRAINRKRIVWSNPPKNTKLLQEDFDVCVGPVVQYRDETGGKSLPFLTAKNLSPWKITARFIEFANFKCSLHSGPFVVIRRTSRPEDKVRAVGTIISSKRKFLVDNHLIIVKPKKGGLGSCQVLLRKLKSEITTTCLNRRLRCRHLTVSAIKELPI